MPTPFRLSGFAVTKTAEPLTDAGVILVGLDEQQEWNTARARILSDAVFQEELASRQPRGVLRDRASWYGCAAGQTYPKVLFAQCLDQEFLFFFGQPVQRLERGYVSTYGRGGQRNKSNGRQPRIACPVARE